MLSGADDHRCKLPQLSRTLQALVGFACQVSPQSGSIPLADYPFRLLRHRRIDTQQVVPELSWMNVEMQMRHLLECGFTNGVPQAEALILKGGANSRRHTRE